MEILSFKISGKMAHFRKYFANNTAFSFSIPPRTTLMGMVAAALGLSRDSYYEDFASENIHFGVRVLTPLKKSFHRLNFLSIKSNGDMSKKWSSDFRGENGRIQTPFEIVSSWDITKEDVCYQIFVGHTQKGKEIYEKIKKHLLYHQPVYTTTLGTANFTARISDVELFEENNIQKTTTEDYIFMDSAVPVALVKDLQFQKDDYDSYNFVEEDMLPGDFKSNGEREVSKMNRLLFSITPNPLRLKLTDFYYNLKNREGDELNIKFMDE